MENQLQTFTNQEFGELRATVKDGEPWFMATDVCRSLDVLNVPQAVGRLDDDEKGICLTDTLGGKQRKMIVSESGLYSLVLGSRKPQAHEFKRWVTHDVIPAIRKHGVYATPETLDKMILSPEFGIKVFTALKDEQEKRKAAEEQRLAEQARREKAEAQIEADAPKVQFADSVASSRQSILIREMAKLLKQNGVDFGEKRFFSWLRANGYLVSSGDDYNLPTQYSMERGIMIIRERTYTDDINTRIMRTPMITGKGQQYFIKKFVGKDKK